jgi:hypothetical protein
MTLDSDLQAAEVPLVHIDSDMEDQLRSQYSANVEPGDQMSLGTPSELTQPEVDMVQQARQVVLSAPIQRVAGGKSLRDLIIETVNDQIYQPPPATAAPPNMNSEGVGGAAPDRSMRDQLLSNGKTLRQMVFETVLDSDSSHDTLSEMSHPLEPDIPDDLAPSPTPKVEDDFG